LTFGLDTFLFDGQHVEKLAGLIKGENGGGQTPESVKDESSKLIISEIVAQN
jgi:hypothetical protein